MRLFIRNTDTPYRWAVVSLVAVLVALAGGGLAARELLEGGAAVPPPTLIERNTLKLLNQQRARFGLKPLTYSAQLAVLARQHTADMIRRNYFAHDAPGGPTYTQRMQQTLHSPGVRRLAENIAYGYPTAASLVAGWMRSPGHRANILDARLHRSGLGIQVAAHYQRQARVTVSTNEFSN